MARRVGLSMRVARAVDYQEPRDAIAWDWFLWIRQAFPELDLMLLPNLGPRAVAYFQRWQLDGLILSGGNHIGSEPQRDQTELALLDMAKARGIPTLGICRGLQLIQTWAGGVLSPCSQHVACSHEVRFLDNRFTARDSRFQVNSFHKHGVLQSRLAAGLEAVAVCESDGTVEALAHGASPISAIMWHPERSPGCALDPQIFRIALEL